MYAMGYGTQCEKIEIEKTENEPLRLDAQAH